jgi:hypothetical protein
VPARCSSQTAIARLVPLSTTPELERQSRRRLAVARAGYYGRESPTYERGH